MDKYALLTLAKYTALNQSINDALGYPDESGTIRYAPEEPIRDIYNNCVMPITSDIQIKFVSLLANLTLYETYETFIPTN